MPHSTIEKAALAKSIAHELRLRGDIARERDPLKEDPQPDDTVKVLPERLRAICAQFSVTNSGVSCDPASLNAKFAKLLIAHTELDGAPKPGFTGLSMTLNGHEGRQTSELHIALKGLREIERQLDSHEELGNLLASAHQVGQRE